MATGIEMKKSFHVGAIPRWTLSTRIDRENRHHDDAADDVARAVAQRRPEQAAQVVGHEERRDGDRDDVVEHLAPRRSERDELIERMAGEAGGATRLREANGP